MEAHMLNNSDEFIINENITHAADRSRNNEIFKNTFFSYSRLAHKIYNFSCFPVIETRFLIVYPNEYTK